GREPVHEHGEDHDDRQQGFPEEMRDPEEEPEEDRRPRAPQVVGDAEADRMLCRGRRGRRFTHAAILTQGLTLWITPFRGQASRPSSTPKSAWRYVDCAN